MRCGYCEKGLKADNKLGFCNIDCRRNKQLSSKKHRTGTPTKAQEPLFNEKNYKDHSRSLKKQHRKYDHIVNVPI